MNFLNLKSKFGEKIFVKDLKKYRAHQLILFKVEKQFPFQRDLKGAVLPDPSDCWRPSHRNDRAGRVECIRRGSCEGEEEGN